MSLRLVKCLISHQSHRLNTDEGHQIILVGHLPMEISFLTLPLPSLLVPTPFTKGGAGGRSSRPPNYLKNRCPHEPESSQGIRDTFESLRNVKVVYIVFTWLP